MKKTLVALAVAAFASSASALTVYEADGSKVDFDGSIRLRLDNGDSKVKGESKKEKHSNLHNDGSRFGVRMKHNIAEDFYALGRVEFRFNSGASGTDQFGDLYAHRAYVGLGSKQYGELTFGRQVLIGDNIAQAGFDYAYGTFDGTLAASGKAAVRYDYKGIEGLQIGLDYRFAEERAKDNQVKTPYQKDPKDPNSDTVYPIKNGYGVGAVYDFKIAEGQSATLAAGYTRDNYKSDPNNGHLKHHKDAWQVGAKYTVNALTLAADYAGSFEKTGSTKDRFNGFRLGVKYQVTPAVSVYSNFGHRVSKDKEGHTTISKTTGNKYMVGAAYKLHKNVLTYVEGAVDKSKKTEGMKTTKKTSKDIGVGLRVSW